jgi:hypothetical protein
MSELIEAANYVRVTKFNGEGTGHQLSFVRPWSIGEPIHFRVEARQATETLCDYTAYLDGQLVGTVRTNGNLIESMYTFIEDIRYGADAAHLRVRTPQPVHSMQTTLRVMRSDRRTFYVACGMRRAYFGIQDLNNLGEQRVLFSVWDIGSTCVVVGERPKRNLQSAAINRTAIFEHIQVRTDGAWHDPSSIGFTANDWRAVSAGCTKNGYYLSTGGNVRYAEVYCEGK